MNVSYLLIETPVEAGSENDVRAVVVAWAEGGHYIANIAQGPKEEIHQVLEIVVEACELDERPTHFRTAAWNGEFIPVVMIEDVVAAYNKIAL